MVAIHETGSDVGGAVEIGSGGENGIDMIEGVRWWEDLGTNGDGEAQHVAHSHWIVTWEVWYRNKIHWIVQCRVGVGLQSKAGFAHV